MPFDWSNIGTDPQSQMIAMQAFDPSYGGDSLDTVTGFGPGTPQYEAYRANIDFGNQLVRDEDPGKGGMFGSATDAFKLAALSAAGMGFVGGANGAFLGGSGGAAGAAGAAAGGSGGLTGVNYAGTYLPQIGATGAGAGVGVGTGASGGASGFFRNLLGGGGGSTGGSAGGSTGGILGNLFGGSGGTDLAGIVASLFGSYQSSQAQGDMANRLTTTLGTNGLTGPGGATAFSNENGAGVNLGALANLFGQQTGFAGDASGMARGALNGGVPSNIAGFSNALNNQPLDLSTFLNTQSGANSLSGSALADALNPNNTAQSIGAQQLALMRNAARPQELQAMQDFSQNLYSTGRGAVTGAAGNEGSIGGGRLAAAFGQGLGRADLDRQVAAQAQGQSAALSQSNLMSNAFQRFADSSNLAGNANTAAFNRARGVATDAYGNAVNQATMPANIAAAFQNLTTSGQGGALGLGDYGNSLMSAALQNSQAGANARLGGNNNLVSYMNNRSDTPVLDTFGKLMGGLSQPNSGGGGIASFFQNLFGGRKQVPVEQTPFVGYGA